MKKQYLYLVGILLLITVGFFIFRGNFSSTGNVIQEEETISIPLSEISEKVSFYKYGSINYFAVRASDGSVKIAFDACDVCGGSKGYRQEGGDMVCNNCGRHFDIDSLGEKNIYGGGCWPSHLPAEIKGDNVLIKISDIEKGRNLF